MGYHTYDLAEFNLDAVGKHRTYVYTFAQEPEIRIKFAEDIGIQAVSITSAIPFADFAFLSGLPEEITPHAIWYATIVVVCPRREEARRFLAIFKDNVRSVEQGFASRLFRGPPGPPPPIASIEGIGIISIPPDENLAHDRVVATIAHQIRNGRLPAFFREGQLEEARRDLSNLTNLKCRLLGNTIVVGTRPTLLRPYESSSSYVPSDVQQLLGALTAVQKELNQLPKDREIDSVFKEIKKFRREIAKAQDQNGGVSIQMSAGFEMFGNGLKVIYQTRKLPVGTLTKVQNLLKQATEKR